MFTIEPRFIGVKYPKRKEKKSIEVIHNNDIGEKANQEMKERVKATSN